MCSPTDKKRRFIQALQYDNHAMQMPQWSENVQSVLEPEVSAFPRQGSKLQHSGNSPLTVSFLPVSPIWNTRAEQLLLNTQATARTSKLVPTDPKQCQGLFLPSAVLPNVRKRWDRRKVCQEVCTCTTYSSMLLLTVVPRDVPQFYDTTSQWRKRDQCFILQPLQHRSGVLHTNISTDRLHLQAWGEENLAQDVKGLF